jgi:hypothetical protein
MDSKASAPPQGAYPPTGFPDAPPSYEASMGQPNYGPPPLPYPPQGASAVPQGKSCHHHLYIEEHFE